MKIPRNQNINLPGAPSTTLAYVRPLEAIEVKRNPGPNPDPDEAKLGLRTILSLKGGMGINESSWRLCLALCMAVSRPEASLKSGARRSSLATLEAT